LSAEPRPELDPTIADYYGRAPEESRLEHGAFRLEEARTRELIQRHVPRPPATVLDVGGAAGAYALWLASMGYDVHLVDPVPRLVGEAARRNEGATRHLVSCRVGDARALDFPDATADLVLMLGPLYHLTERTDRVRALGEARRVLKPGARVLVAGISRAASALDGLSRGLFADPRFGAIVARDLRDGQHRNSTERLDYFTTAYFHRPAELAREIADAGLVVEGIYGIEGPGWILPDIAERMEDDRRRTDVLHVARLLESDPEVLGASAHILAVAVRRAALTDPTLETP
jgi:ubiquinone/menaquinone biosynthesis C-methylase UbiE